MKSNNRSIKREEKGEGKTSPSTSLSKEITLIIAEEISPAWVLNVVQNALEKEMNDIRVWRMVKLK